MEFLKGITYIKGPQYFVLLFGASFLMNPLKSLPYEDKFYSIKNNKSYDFEKVYFQNSLPYERYDTFSGQLKTFFGLNSEMSNFNNYPDLNIISDSEALREIYKSKLNDMIINEYHLKK